MQNFNFKQSLKTEKQMLKLIHKYPFTIVYGAGMVGTLTVNRLLANGVEAHKIVVAISNKSSGQAENLCGIKVCDIDEVSQYVNNAIIIIATMPELHEEIHQSLDSRGYRNIISVSLRLYSNMCYYYIQDFYKQYPVNICREAKTKILFMASDNNRTSGAFLCMVELCSLLKQYGIEVVVILPCYGNGEVLLKETGISFTYILSEHWGYENIREHDFLYKVMFRLRLLKNQKAKKRLIYFMQEYDINLVHCNTSYTYIGAAAAKKINIPFIWHIREDMEGQGYSFFSPQKAKNLIKQSNKIIFVSKYMKSKLQLDKGNKTVVLYDAIGNLNEADDRDILIDTTVKMILIGAISPHKGQKELIDACEILKNNKFSSYQLLLVGKGEKHYVEELNKQVEICQLNNNILFYGQSDDVKSLYEEADISFMCSKAEPYGRVTIEAQLSGCLVIGAASGATTELIEDGRTGYLYEAGNARRLADCIIKAISDVERSRQIAISGQKHAQKTYTQQNQLRSILELYEGVLGRKLI